MQKSSEASNCIRRFNPKFWRIFVVSLRSAVTRVSIRCSTSSRAIRFSGCHLRATHKIKTVTVTVKVVSSMRLCQQAVAKLQSEIFYWFPYKARRPVLAGSWPDSQRHSNPDSNPMLSSRALQNATWHWLTVPCASAASYLYSLPCSPYPSPLFLRALLTSLYIVFCCWQVRVCFPLIAHIVNRQPYSTHIYITITYSILWRA